MRRRLDRLFDFCRPGFVPRGQNMAVPVWHHLRGSVAGPYFFPTDDQRDLDLLGRHCGNLLFESLPFGSSGRVGSNGFIQGNRNSISTHDSTSSSQFTVEATTAKARFGLASTAVRNVAPTP